MVTILFLAIGHRDCGLKRVRSDAVSKLKNNTIELKESYNIKRAEIPVLEEMGFEFSMNIV